MGPLFSVAVVAVLAVVLGAVCFACARVFLPTNRAATVAVLGVGGAGVGALIAVLLAVPFVGHTLESTTAVLSYLLTLCAGAAVGGAFAVVVYLRASRKEGQHAV